MDILALPEYTILIQERQGDEQMGVGMISLWDLEYRLNAGIPMQLVDLRTPSDYQAGHIRGAVNIPYSNLASRLPELASGPAVIFYCARGGISLQAARMAAQRGIPAASVMSGITYYRGAHMIRS